MATKKATAATAAEKEVKAPAKKACAKKACATKAAAPKAAPAKKAPAKKAAAVVYVNAENAGFRAGDIYQTLAANNAAMTVAEIAKAAKVSEQDVLLGLGWLLKEGKIAATEDNKVVLA